MVDRFLEGNAHPGADFLWASGCPPLGGFIPYRVQDTIDDWLDPFWAPGRSCTTNSTLDPLVSTDTNALAAPLPFLLIIIAGSTPNEKDSNTESSVANQIGQKLLRRAQQGLVDQQAAHRALGDLNEPANDMVAHPTKTRFEEIFPHLPYTGVSGTKARCTSTQSGKPRYLGCLNATKRSDIN